MLEIDVDRFTLAMDYIEGFDDRVMSMGELGLIYSVLPEVLLELMSPEGIMLTDMKKE